MDIADQTGSTLGALIDAVACPSVADLPMAFIVLVLAVFAIAALPESAREKLKIIGIAAIGLIVSFKLFLPANWLAILR
jgi:hypothetical protein